MTQIARLHRSQFSRRAHALRKRCHVMSLNQQCSSDEDGAILILALVFILLISLSVLGLLTFGGTGIKNAASLQGQRDIEYAADGATTAAIEGVRYSFENYESNTYQWPTGPAAPSPTPPIGTPPTAPCLPSGASQVTIDGDAMVVSCLGTPTQQTDTRVITFYACLLPSGNAANTYPCSSNDDVVAATVDFQDVSSSGIYDCSDAQDMTTCGTGMVVTSWIVDNDNGSNT